jgi:hypothetical protein
MMTVDGYAHDPDTVLRCSPVDPNPLAAFPWLHFAANLVYGVGWLASAVFILVAAWKLLTPSAWRWRHWTTYVLAWDVLVLVAVVLAVALIATLVGRLSQG